MQPISVYCDFDGTITKGDTVDFLLDRLAAPGWELVEAQWKRGKIGSRECMSRQIPMIRGGWKAIEEALKDVEVDPTFASFARWCSENRVPLTVVSEGLDRVIHTLLAREGIQVDGIWANHLEENEAGELSLSFPNPPANMEQCRAGLCKCQILSNGEARSLKVVIGDGLSDLCWASEADWLFAKSKLLTHCRQNQIPCKPFEDFDGIQAALKDALKHFAMPKTGSFTRSRREALYAKRV